MKHPNKSKTGKRLLAAGAVCLAAAAALFVYNIISDSYAGSYSHRIVNEMTEYISQQKTDREPDSSSVSSSDNSQARKGISSVFSSDGCDYIGYLTIPSLELELPVASSWSYDRLNLTPCRYSGSLVTRDLVIAGHNYDSHFGRIGSLSEGSEVIFTNVMGDSFHYVTVLTESLSPDETVRMTCSGYDLSLFTCNLMGTERVTVRCRKR